MCLLCSTLFILENAHRIASPDRNWKALHRLFHSAAVVAEKCSIQGVLYAFETLDNISLRNQHLQLKWPVNCKYVNWPWKKILSLF